MTPKAIATTLALVAASVTLAGCSAEPGPPPLVTAESGVVLWPDYGDFLVEGNKAITPTVSLRIAGRDVEADTLQRIAGTAQARWVGHFQTDDRIVNLTRNIFADAAASGRIALLAYAGLPDGVCAMTDFELSEQATAYAARAHAVSDPLEGVDAKAWLIFEPGAVLGLADCAQSERVIAMMNGALATFYEAGIEVYIGAGSALSNTPADVAAALLAIDLNGAAGVAVGVGGYTATELEAAYGESVVAELARNSVRGLGFVIDTSRNGLATAGAETCNAPDQAIGLAPRVVNEGALDAYVWVKRPGESDGLCNGGIEQGQFLLSLALALAGNGVPEDA